MGANTVVYSAAGKVDGCFCIGDDIDVLVTDRAVSMWTAYGDEGIYGSHPQSAGGLAGWDRRGDHTWAPKGRLARPSGRACGHIGAAPLTLDT
ncbi:hypothetical protein Asi02nite_20410 [Asanoa siamensis]|uniref:Uncharacterized protein n=1 Tax=Asanoa siamensis TaxID=926357 RepID=A0ABQ4CML1_9ACTN|nr:hypothetical protein Asi02nite_20410 [Asanoa siamensis]